MKIHTPVVDDKCWALERMREFPVELNYEGMNPAEVLNHLVKRIGPFEVVAAAAWLGRNYTRVRIPMREENFRMVVDPWSDNDGEPLPAVRYPMLHSECAGCMFYDINDECANPHGPPMCPRGFKEIDDAE